MNDLDYDDIRSLSTKLAIRHGNANLLAAVYAQTWFNTRWQGLHGDERVILLGAGYHLLENSNYANIRISIESVLFVEQVRYNKVVMMNEQIATSLLNAARVEIQFANTSLAIANSLKGMVSRVVTAVAPTNLAQLDALEDEARTIRRKGYAEIESFNQAVSEIKSRVNTFVDGIVNALASVDWSTIVDQPKTRRGRTPTDLNTITLVNPDKSTRTLSTADFSLEILLSQHGLGNSPVLLGLAIEGYLSVNSVTTNVPLATRAVRAYVAKLIEIPKHTRNRTPKTEVPIDETSTTSEASKGGRGRN